MDALIDDAPSLFAPPPAVADAGVGALGARSSVSLLERRSIDGSLAADAQALAQCFLEFLEHLASGTED